MIDWKGQLRDELTKQRAALLADGQLVMADTECLKERLKTAGLMPSDPAWAAFCDGLRQLSLAVERGTINTPLLDKASVGFDSLGTKPPAKGATTGAAVTAAVLASYGKTLTALIAGDLSDMLAIVYRTTEAYPEVAVQVFSPLFFGSEIREILIRSYRELQRTVRVYHDLRRSNKSKRRKSIPTFLVRSLLFAPLSYLMALSKAPGALPVDARSTGRRAHTYWGKVKVNQELQLKSFDTKAATGGWSIGMNEIQKEMMLLDQVKRLTSIHHNHVLAASLDAKARRRELEAPGKR